MSSENSPDSFSKDRAELFEALGHPTRIRILELLANSPLGFSDLKKALGIDSGGQLQFHLGKLQGLVKTVEGNYALTDEGKEALRIMAIKKTPDKSEIKRVKSKPLQIISIILIFALAISIFYEFSLYNANMQLDTKLSNLNQEYNNSLTMLARYPWIFKGAYAVYSGQAEGMFTGLPGMQPQPLNISETVRIEIMEFNGTHVRWLFSFLNRSSSMFGPTDYSGDWVVPGYSYVLYEQNLTKINETDIFINGLGIRHCSIYQGDSFLGFLFIYIDQESGWPIKLEISENFHITYSVELNMTESNIPGLTITH